MMVKVDECFQGFYYCKMFMKLKEKFYRTAITPVMLYGSGYQATKKHHVKKMSVGEMRDGCWQNTERCDKK